MAKHSVYAASKVFGEEKFHVVLLFLSSRDYLNEGTPDWVEMYLMSQCKHNIIANSSFSWWGAYLNRNSDKIIVAPQKWINGKTMKNICPNEWIRIERSI